MVLFIGAIMSVDAELYEAAALDGANKVQQFFHIILPNIKTIVTLNVILSITGSLSAFEPPFVITGGANGLGYELVEEAKTTSSRELKEKWQASNVEAGLRNKQITFTFKLFADQAEIVRNAITQVQQDFGYENPNQAFEHIITEWAEEHLNVEAAANEGTEER